jgi:acetylornithine/N-succinyldiaminopimelate aminotransferase
VFEKGEKYLDFVQGIAVNSLGHSHPKLIKSLINQSKKLWHVSNSFIIPEGELLAKKISKKTFADVVMFQNSGAEATEAAIKVARRYFYSIGKPNKNRILCIKNSFHGRTLAAIYASGSKKMTEGFGPKVGGFDHFEFGDHKSLKKKITKNTAAIMVETIMGEGGIKVIPDWCLKGLRKICNKKNILLILDEVQSGISRTGDFFAFEQSKVKPDIVPIAKGIGGGFPIGAVLMNKKVASGMTPGTHGSTFLFINTAPIGNPPPIPFAIGTMSGFTLDCSKAKKSPVLEIPDCTSSKISNIFFLLQIFLNPFKHQSGITFIPPSPMMVSTIIAAVFLVIFFFSDL